MYNSDTNNSFLYISSILLILLNSKEINFLNVDFNFVLLNSGETFIEQLNNFNEIYMEEYITKNNRLRTLFF